MQPVLRSFGIAFAVLGLLASIFEAPPAWAADEDDDELPVYRPGLVATYSQAGRPPVLRTDDDVQLVGRAETTLDERLSAGPCEVAWRGRLFSLAPGEYRLHFYLHGTAVVRLNGTEILRASAKAPGWHESLPVKLAYGHHPLEIDFAATSADYVCKLHWSGPQFGVEPVPERHLFHDPDRTPSTSFEDGRMLVRALRCAACHDLPDEAAPLPGPALTHLAGNLERDWLLDRLAPNAAADKLDPAQRRMPHLPLSRDDAGAIADYLFAKSQSSAKVELPKSVEPPPEPKPNDPDAKKKAKPRTKPWPHAGELLTHGLGCLACHRLGKLGSDGLFNGPDLSNVAAKRPPEFFVRWFDDAAKVNSRHRMPQFKLERLERDDLIVYLQTLGNPAAKSADEQNDATKSSRDLDLGRKLTAEHRCAACHQLPDDAPKPERAKPVTTASNWTESCLESPVGSPARTEGTEPRRPGYLLDATAKKAVIDYLAAARPEPRPTVSDLDGRFVLAERNCIGCHARGRSTGLAERVGAITAAHPELAAVQAALLPPALHGVGDKLTDAAFPAAVKTERPPLRSWLKARMPKFDLSDAETQALQRYLVDHDRIPDRPPSPAATSDDVAQRLAARRLVTADGFGCTSCHQIGKAEPSGTIALAARGTDLSLVGERIRKPWFDRWVRNPARIVPRMEMPAVQLAVRGVLHDDLNEQLASVWKVLNEPGFTPPKPNPVRIVRSRNVPGLPERLHVLTDVFILDDITYASPIVIGLPNRHNVLFDLEKNRLAAWWTGDTALERTKGKSWYWEAGGELIPLSSKQNEASPAVTDLRFHTSNGRELMLFARSQNLAELESIESGDGFVQIVTRIYLSDDGRRFARIRQTFEPLRNPVAGRSGLRRHAELLEHNWPEALKLSLSAEESTATPTGAVHDLTTDRPLDTFPNEIPALPSPPSQALDVVPGFTSVRLPLPAGEMPTGLAWSRDGSFVVSSLKGRILRAFDSNGDGTEEALTAISDDLATPYGVAVAKVRGKNGNEREAIDVITKTALVRLHDENGDGFHERQEIVADGWGHTDDYHDWAVGLPKIVDENGNDAGYYIALPCMQDDRTEAKARLRGQALRLVPREPTPTDPRRFSIEPFAAGLRFPMGLAVDRRGRLFASDNQGNYNPFNELNHLQPGLRYGFINKNERSPDFSPPTESPAIEIPHPWTRSVNGLCFLDTPDALRTKSGNNAFGPFEGHLIGCEFNQRMLVRMSLEEVDGVMQGAIYPFSIQPDDPNATTFEGPNVAAVSPDGALYVGSLRDSGWGGGQNTGSIVRVTPAGDGATPFGKLPRGIAEVRAEADGFTIHFTDEVDARRAAETKQYVVEKYRRESTPQYGGDDMDRANVGVQTASVADDRRSVRLKIDRPTPGFVYEFHLRNLTSDDGPWFPAEAYYTLKRAPL